MQEQEHDGSTYRIGAVSRLTRIPAETLRVWERRYHVVEPRRAGGQTRIYDREDVERLCMIKQLVDRGHAISTVASLTREELEARLEDHLARAESTGDEARPGVSVVVIGETLSSLVSQQPSDLESVEVVSTADDPTELSPDVRDAGVRVAVLECQVVDDRTIRNAQALLRRTGATRLVVVYGFGTRGALARLSRTGFRAVRGPLTTYELRRVILETDGQPPNAPASPAPIEITDDDLPARRYTAPELARIGSFSSAVQCECPSQLVALVTQLLAFEAYSKGCENKNDDDAALHAELTRVTAQCRARMEAALAKVVEAEGIVI